MNSEVIHSFNHLKLKALNSYQNISKQKKKEKWILAG